MKLNTAHINDRPKMTDANIITPISESGANPSGVEDPKIGIYKSIIN
jgi:hypothetical protein